MDKSTCRVCFTNERLKLLSLFSTKIDDRTLAEMLNFLSGIEITQDDSLPEMICVECLNHVSSACDTKRKCIEADEKLRDLLKKNQPASEIIHVPANPSNIELQQGDIILEVIEIETTEKSSIDPDPDENSTDIGTVTSQDSPREILQPKTASLRKSVITKQFETKSKSTNIETLPLPKDFQCDFCGFLSKRKKNLERHLLAVHLKQTKFLCEIDGCGRKYTTQAALNLHSVRDHDQNSPFQCEKCNQKFSCESLFKIHQQRLSCRPRKSKTSKKSLEKSLTCSHCDFKTAYQFSLKQHVNLIHLNIKKTFKCSHCDIAEFSNRTSLNQHLFNIHNLSHIRCSDCDQAFVDEIQLKNHKESLKCNARQATDDDFQETKTGVKCNLCSRTYKSKKEWITHYFNHHKFNKVCDVCGLKLSTYASLKNHKKTIHEKVKAFACTECPKKFSAKHTLEFHLNSHSGLKPFSCKFCSFKAADRSSVSKHQKKQHAGMS